jgi:hypothetical protein
MNATLTLTHLEIELTPFERIGGLTGNRAIPRGDITSARIDPDPLRRLRGRLKVGLRIPGTLFVCWTGLGREFWAVRRGVPALHVTVAGERRPRELTVSTPDAQRIAAALDRPG